jgi:hypothetical protein
MKWVRGIAAFVAALFAALLWIVAHDSDAFAGDDSPERLSATYQTLSLI